ncbi:ABC transporter permease subunit [Clostridium sp. MCC353]|uniref:carbohydrate ABC transporter permease n=1 Tax=Clostridium sp. MCC353 TaxID=2592646 RepID=UPI001C016EA0|nr:sugar ABC transporter permease [Clostridium sp. MCC353]MBT9777996.1 ABC transporter permease subunit [Clostridium sp. MCC353]
MKKKLLYNQSASAWLMSAPALITLFIFVIIPFLMSFMYSFTNKQFVMAANNPLRFVGLENYIRVLSSGDMAAAAKNTLKYTVYVVPALTILPLLLALLLNNRLKGMTAFRVICFSPQVISMAVVSVVWAFILGSADGSMMNTIIGFFGIPPQGWLKDPSQSLFSIAVMSIWSAIGFNMIIYLSGIQFISQDIYEAAQIDGCRPVQKFFYITFPLLKNTVIFIVMTNIISSLKLFTQILVLTKGGPMKSTMSLVYLIYETGFVKMQIGVSAAQSVVFFVVVMVVSMIQSKVLLKEDKA